MRISGNSNLEVQAATKAQVVQSSKSIQSSQGSSTLDEVNKKPIEWAQKTLELDNSEEIKAKVKEAVNSMNEMLEATNNASKFMFHEGLERYYVTVVDRQTEEVVKEIPPRKLLDAFYEMQKMLGMIVDEKI